jgi:hypothetical protein
MSFAGDLCALKHSSGVRKECGVLGILGGGLSVKNDNPKSTMQALPDSRIGSIPSNLIASMICLGADDGGMEPSRYSNCAVFGTPKCWYTSESV